MCKTIAKIIEIVVEVLDYMRTNLIHEYTRIANNLASRGGFKGIIYVVSVPKSLRSRCYIACSVGVRVFGKVIGVIFVNKNEFAKLNEKVKLFVLAHEVGHIALGHVVASLTLKIILDVLIRNQGLKRTKPLIELLNLLLKLAITRKQELEADEFAMEVVGLEASIEFAKWLERLQHAGYTVSHAVEPGIPVLTIEERKQHILNWWIMRIQQAKKIALFSTLM